MKKSLCILSAALIVASSCSKYEQPVETNEVKMVSATINAESGKTGDGTKTIATYDTGTQTYKITWEVGDELSVFNSSTSIPMTKFTAISAGEKTKFNGEIPDPSTINYAILPYDAKATASGDFVYTSISPEQSGDFSNIVLAGWPKGTMAETGTEYNLNYQFEAVCGIVKFSFDPIYIAESKTITRISFISDLPISGDAKIDYSGATSDTPPVMTANPSQTGSGTFNVVTISKPEGFDKGDYYIATFPIKSESQLGIVLRFETSDNKVAYKNAKLTPFEAEGGKHIFAANIVKNIGTVKITEYLPTGFTEKPFSVSATKQVYFSPGNLQYQASGNDGNGLWRFAPNQWDAQGELGNTTAPATSSGNEGLRASQSEWIDLFPWGHTGCSRNGKNYHPYMCGNVTDGYFCDIQTSGHTLTTDTIGDWGKYCDIMNGDELDAKGTWRTLTYAELEYMLNLTSPDPGANKGGRANINKVNKYNKTGRYMYFSKIGIKTGVFVGGKEIIKYGLIIFPDEFEWPSIVPAPTYSQWPHTTFGWKGCTNDNAPKYSLTDFVLLEQAGCVFLPAAGQRLLAVTDEQTGKVSVSVNNYNTNSYYWTTSKPRSTEHLSTTDGNVSWEMASPNTQGRSVRLVKDVPAE